MRRKGFLGTFRSRAPFHAPICHTRPRVYHVRDEDPRMTDATKEDRR